MKSLGKAGCEERDAGILATVGIYRPCCIASENLSPAKVLISNVFALKH